jgi:hypothetical protein
MACLVGISSIHNKVIVGLAAAPSSHEIGLGWIWSIFLSLDDLNVVAFRTINADISEEPVLPVHRSPKSNTQPRISTPLNLSNFPQAAEGRAHSGSSGCAKRERQG